MRIFLYELKKIWNWRIVAIVAALGVLVWFAALADFRGAYDSLATHGVYGGYQTEMFALYGEELSQEELEDYDIPGKLAEVRAEADAIVAAEPVFAKYGISDFEDYLEFEGGLTYVVIGDSVKTMRNGETVSGGDYGEMDALLNGGGEGKTLDEEYGSPAVRANCLKNLESRYMDYENSLEPYIRNDLRPVVVRAAKKLVETRNASLIRDDLCQDFSGYAAVVGVFAVLAAILLAAPLVATDRARRINLLQYSSSAGRRIFRTQLAATALSASLLSLTIVAAGYVPFVTAAWEYRNARIMALDTYGMWLYDITFGQYALILAAMSVALSVGAACFTFALARFSANIVTLMIKAVPVGAAVAAVCAFIVQAALSYNNVVFYPVFQGRAEAPEIVIGMAVTVMGAVTAMLIVAREKRADVT